jgi:hypothetical protein
MRARGASDGARFGFFGKIFHHRNAQPQPIGDGGLMDGIDDDAAEAERLIRKFEEDNAAYFRAKAIAMGGRIGDGDIAILPVDNVIPFVPRSGRSVHVDFNSAS